MRTVHDSSDHHNILIVALPGQGHINPALQFAKRLVSLGANVTFSTTLHMHRRLTNKPTIPGFSYAPFSDGYDHGFTAKVDSDYALYASEFKRRGSEFLAKLIVSSEQDGRPFSCLLHTLLVPWAAEVAREFHLPTALVWVQAATVFDILYHYFHDYGDYINDKAEDPSCFIELPGLPLLLGRRDLPSFLLPSNATLNAVVTPMVEEQFRDLDLQTNPRVVVNSFGALEPEALRAVDKVNMISIGPLIPSAFLDGKDPNDTSFGGNIFQNSNGYIEWLNSKPKLSVVYLSFGSWCVLSKTQMEELAGALLDCGRPFLWVIREKEKKEKEEEQKDKLEEEEVLSCMEELEQKGNIVKWCSQLDVLSHSSIGCFVTHCGWNSTMESLVSGVPMVAFPQCTDQMTNAKLIEDVWKTGVRVDRHVNEEGVVEREHIRRCLEVVMGSGEKGDRLRRNAIIWKGLGREAVKEGGSSERNLRTFLDDVR